MFRFCCCWWRKRGGLCFHFTFNKNLASTIHEISEIKIKIFTIILIFYGNLFGLDSSFFFHNNNNNSSNSNNNSSIVGLRAIGCWKSFVGIRVSVKTKTRADNFMALIAFNYVIPANRGFFYKTLFSLRLTLQLIVRYIQSSKMSLSLSLSQFEQLVKRSILFSLIQ